MSVSSSTYIVGDYGNAVGGVDTITAGTAIQLSGTAQTPVINNIGATSVGGLTGAVAFGSSDGSINFDNTTGIINATVTSVGGVSSIIAGPNISISPTNGLGNVTITGSAGGVSSIIAGPNISISPTNGLGNVTISAGTSVPLVVTGSGTIVAPEGVSSADFMLVGAGGGGGATVLPGYCPGGCGGSGYITYLNNVPLSPFSTITVGLAVGGSGGVYNPTVPEASTAGSAGGESFLVINGTQVLVAGGGGGGGTGILIGPAKKGGDGGSGQFGGGAGTYLDLDPNVGYPGVPGLGVVAPALPGSVTPPLGGRGGLGKPILAFPSNLWGTGGSAWGAQGSDDATMGGGGGGGGLNQNNGGNGGNAFLVITYK